MAGGGKTRARAKKAPAKARKAAARGGKRAKPAAAKARSGGRAAPKARARAKPVTARPAAKAAPVPAGARTGSKLDFSLDKLHQVALTARDLDASVAFYRDLLGLRFIARFDPPGLAFFNLGGGVRLMLSATESAATLYFIVDDLDAAFQKLKKRGVRFMQPPAMIHHDEDGNFGKRGSEEWMAFFRDPGDNILALVERR
jgi:catechol 2,3-dioxygenase-like lactoylglutathione lyase family enzyme